jgi:guanylate kinase
VTQADKHTSGKAIIFSAPSGAGKTTIVNYLLEKYSNFGFSISACTRAKRESETHGKDYYFLNIEEFRQKLKEDAFIESQEVYKDSYYGTLKSEIERLWKEGKHVLFDVDVKGGLNLKEYFKENALAIFITVPSIETLEERLRKRQTDSKESIEKRVAKYKEELSHQAEFDLVITNKDLQETLQEVELIVSQFLESESFKLSNQTR